MGVRDAPPQLISKFKQILPNNTNLPSEISLLSISCPNFSRNFSRIFLANTIVAKVAKLLTLSRGATEWPVNRALAVRSSRTVCARKRYIRLP